MARHIESICKLCRREGVKLFLKGDRCYTDKCAFERRSYAPGQHGQARGARGAREKVTGYILQLREKQKVKRLYGLLEDQFRGYFKKAERLKGVTGENLLVLLERRLDNVVYRLGFADSRRGARQLVTHGHFTVNGKGVNIPSYLVKVGEVIHLREKGQRIARINEALEAVERRGIPKWIELDKDNYRGVINALPRREDITTPIKEQLIVELYSK